MLAKPESALVIVAHGSSVNRDSSAPTLDHAARIAGRGLFGEVHCAFWKEEPAIRQILGQIGSREIYVVPNFISEGHFTQTVVPRELELKGPVTERDGRTIKYCEPSGNHPHMTQFLLQRAEAIAPGVPPKATTLFIVGHGTAQNKNSALAAKREVERIRSHNLYAEVVNAYLEEPPQIADWAALSSQPNVIVVPFFISNGPHSYEDIPLLLGIKAGHGELFRTHPHHIRGKNLYYASAIGTEPRFADVILDQVESFDAQHPFTS